MLVRDLRPDDAPHCDEILHSLPYFFGSDAGNAACADAVRTQRGWVVEDDGAVHGFLTVDYPLPTAPEITWMAVRNGYRRQGLGRALIDQAVRDLAPSGATVISVLTLAASVPENGTDTYAGTRTFYQRTGFLPIREVHPPGWDTPALLLARPLT